ncbi:MAG: DNA polymerase III subunit gamma/tau [Patescibacteria group bacterium]
MTFYLKYRPQKIADLDSKNVRESLQKIVDSGQIPHAFLFSGPKGTGKTSAARILAKIVNCERNDKKLGEPCNKCNQCKSITQGTNIDVIELDAASHRGIDDVRTLRDAVKLSPANARKKVYIIDEAHMLTTEAANALLKTLEEPPDHVMFILATTNPEKLIETIRSRVTNIVFKRASDDEIERSLAKIVKAEKLKDKGGVALIAKASDGSFRDAAKILEEIVMKKIKLQKEDVEEFLFSKKTFNTDEFLKVLSERDVKKALGEVEGAVDSGVNLEAYTLSVLSRLRSALLAKMGLEGENFPELKKEEIVSLLKLFSWAAGELKGAVIEQLPIEIAVVEWCAGGEGTEEESNQKEEEINIEEDKKPVVIKKTSMPVINKDKLKTVSNEMWTKVLETIKPINTSIEALLRAARPIQFDGELLTLNVFYRFHKEKLEEMHHRRVLEQVLAEIFGSPIRVTCVLAEPPAKEIVKEEPKEEVVLTDNADEDIIKVAKEIFGN